MSLMILILPNQRDLFVLKHFDFSKWLFKGSHFVQKKKNGNLFFFQKKKKKKKKRKKSYFKKKKKSFFFKIQFS